MIARLKAAVAAEIDRARRRVVRQIVFGAAAGLIGLTAIGFALSAGYMALARQLGDIPGALVMAGGLIVIALGLVLAMESKDDENKAARAKVAVTPASAAASARVEEAAGQAAEAAGTVRGLVGAIAQELEGPSRQAFLAGAKAAPTLSPLQLTAIAALAGFFYGRRLRR